MVMRNFFVFCAMAALLLSVCGCGTRSARQADEMVRAEADTLGNPVISTILERRSVRRYKSAQVDMDILRQIVECGINAPNGKYNESWEVRVVRNPDFLKEISEGFDAYWKKSGAKRKASAFYDAPCLILIAHDLSYDLSQVDCGLLGGNMILTAQSLGLGTCCLGQVTRFLLSDDGENLLSRLEFPETHRLLYAIALGYPDECPEAKPRDNGKVRFVL